MHIIIRPIVNTDNLAIAGMIRKVFIEYDAPKTGTVYSDPATDHLYELFQIPRSVFWIAWEGNEIAGCCGIYPTKDLPVNYAELVKFYIPQEYRGKGIGKELMQKCFNSAKEYGYTHLYLESLAQFSKAVSIYEKQGFISLAQPLGNTLHESCDIWMLKELQ